MVSRLPNVVLLAALLSLGLLSTVLAQDPAPAKIYTVQAGTRVPLSVVKSINTRSAAPGDPVYLVSTFPVFADGRIVIPAGSYVSGTVLEAKRPGKVKGRGELRLRLDSVLLPNGVKHEFRGNLSDVATPTGEKLNGEGKVIGPGSKLNDVRNVGSIAAMGGMVGGAAGGLATIGQSENSTNSVLHRPIVGSGIGVAGGLAAGLLVTLLTRGPDAMLVRGADIEMSLDQAAVFQEAELAGLPAPPPGTNLPPAAINGLKQR